MRGIESSGRLVLTGALTIRGRLSCGRNLDVASKDSAPDLRPTVILEPLGAWQWPDWWSLWQHRHVLLALLRRDLKTRYRQTLFGPMWFILAPLGRMGVFSIVFGRIAQLPSEGIPYPLFTYVALLPWELFAGAVQRSTQSMVKYQSIIPKVYFPRLLIPIVETLSALVDFSCGLLVLLAMLYFYDVPLSGRVVLLPFYGLVTIMAALSVGLFFAALQVRYRDASQFVGYLLQAWSFATPVAYSSALAAGSFSGFTWFVYRLNPMFAPVEGFRWMFLGLEGGPGWPLLVCIILVTVAFAVGAVFFERTQDLVVDLL